MDIATIAKNFVESGEWLTYELYVAWIWEQENPKKCIDTLESAAANENNETIQPKAA